MHLITAQEITGLNPVEVTNKPQKGGNTSEFQKGARFFFEIKRRVSFCGFQSGALSGKALANPAIFSKRSFIRIRTRQLAERNPVRQDANAAAGLSSFKKEFKGKPSLSSIA